MFYSRKYNTDTFNWQGIQYLRSQLNWLVHTAQTALTCSLSLSQTLLRGCSCMTSQWKCVPPDTKRPPCTSLVFCLWHQIKTVKVHQRITIILLSLLYSLLLLQRPLLPSLFPFLFSPGLHLVGEFQGYVCVTIGPRRQRWCKLAREEEWKAQ